MKGTVKKLMMEKHWGFIVSDEDRQDYFFHSEGFAGHWGDLCDDWGNGIVVKVEFEPTKGAKGLRAESVHRIDNQ